jgi:hypothetical protein
MIQIINNGFELAMVSNVDESPISISEFMGIR